MKIWIRFWRTDGLWVKIFQMIGLNVPQNASRRFSLTRNTKGEKKERTYWLKAFVVSGFDHMQFFHKLYYLIRTLNILFSSFINNIFRSLRKPQSARHQCRRFHLQSLNLNMYIPPISTTTNRTMIHLPSYSSRTINRPYKKREGKLWTTRYETLIRNPKPYS